MKFRTVALLATPLLFASSAIPMAARWHFASHTSSTSISSAADDHLAPAQPLVCNADPNALNSDLADPIIFSSAAMTVLFPSTGSNFASTFSIDWRDLLGQGATQFVAAPTSAPEPASLMLLSLAAIPLLRRQKR